MSNLNITAVATNTLNAGTAADSIDASINFDANTVKKTKTMLGNINQNGCSLVQTLNTLFIIRTIAKVIKAAPIAEPLTHNNQ